MIQDLMIGLVSEVPHNTFVNLTDGNFTVYILPRSHA